MASCRRIRSSGVIIQVAGAQENLRNAARSGPCFAEQAAIGAKTSRPPPPPINDPQENLQPGETRLRAAIRRISKRFQSQPPPAPEDPQWPPSIEARLRRLESRQRWLLALSVATLAAVSGIKPELIADIVLRSLQALSP